MGVEMLKQVADNASWQRLKPSKGLAKSVAIAVVGCGYWGSKHVRVLAAMRDVGQVIAVDPDPAVCKRLSTAFPNIRTSSTLTEVLHEVDGVIVATPPHNHVDVALVALRAGKHVLIEKPIATSVKDANRIMKASQATGAIVVAGHTYEFNPIVHDLRRRINSGEFGEIRYIHSARLNLGLYRTDVNVVWDLAPHDISIMNFLLGESPSMVRAWGFSCMARGVVDVAHYQLEYSRRGVVGYGFNSWIDPKKVRQLTVVGSKKMAVFDDVSEEKLRIFDHQVVLPSGYGMGSPGAPLAPVNYSRGDVVTPSIDYGEPLQLENQNFVDAIRGGALPQVDAQNGLEVVKVLEAIDLAMARGKSTPVKSQRTSALN